MNLVGQVSNPSLMPDVHTHTHSDQYDMNILGLFCWVFFRAF